MAVIEEPLEGSQSAKEPSSSTELVDLAEADTHQDCKPQPGPPAWPPVLWRYLLALASVAVATGIRAALNTVLGNGFTFVTFYPAVAVAGMLAGRRAGFLATALSILAADFLFIPPYGNLIPDSIGDWVGLGLFAAGGGLISVMAGMLDRARTREWAAAERADRAEEQRAIQERLRETETRYQALFENMSEGFAVGQALHGPDGKPQDFCFLEVNDAFTRQSGLTREILGKPMKQVLPKLEPYWVDRYCAVAMTGKSVHFEAPNIDTGRHYDVFCYCPMKGKFAIVFSDITERKHAEQALRLRESELNEAQRLAHIGNWHWAAATDVTTGSDELLRIFGLDPQIESMPRFKEQRGRCYPAADWETLNAAMQESLRTGGGYELDVQALRGKATIWITSRGEVVRDAEGRIAGLRGTVQDITERKQAEEKLRRSEARWNAAIENFGEGAIIATEAEQLIYWNPAAWRSHGFASAEEGLGPLSEKQVFELRTPEGRLLELEEWPMRRIKRGETVRALELRLRRLDQVWERIVSYSGAMVETAGGERLIFLSVHDLTEQRQAEAALREAKQRLEAHMENSPLAVVEFDREFRLTRWSHEAERLFGWTATEVIGRRMGEWRWVYPDDDAAARRVAEDMLSGRSPRNLSGHRNFRKDGSIVHCEWYSSALYDAEGRVTSILSQALNVTERKQAEEVLQRSKQDLEQLVAERTAKLQELVTELEHFSYSITHDLKSPLRAMRGFAEMASQACEAGSDSEARGFLGKVSTASDRMDALIRDALNYSRSVGQELPLEDVDTGALLRGMMDTYPELQPSRANISIEGPLPVVLGNLAGLTQCFSNLLGNAVKFVKPGRKPEIRVGAVVLGEDQNSGWVRIWIEDEGIGISKEMLPRVFDMFSRGSKDYEGTGIGLALVRKVTQRMGGRVGVESEPGKGSRFWIELKTGEIAARPRVERKSSPSVGGGIVLYVEDEESDALFMQRAIVKKGLGAALRLVSDGRAAIDYLSGAGKYADRKQYALPDVILLDLNLPQVHGFEVLKWVRNHPDLAATPVVVFSSSTREDDRLKALALGANAFLSKPKSALEFGDVVDALRETWLVKS